MQLIAAGQVAAIVPFVSREKRHMILYKGDAALAARRDVASKLTHSLIAALKRPTARTRPTQRMSGGPRFCTTPTSS